MCNSYSQDPSDKAGSMVTSTGGVGEVGEEGEASKRKGRRKRKEGEREEEKMRGQPAAP